MKGYVVTLMDLPQSVEVAQRCIESGKKFNVNVEMFPAVKKDIALQELEKEGLRLAKFDETYSNVGAVIGNVVSQYRIWKIIAEGSSPAIILEHDAVFVGEVPNLKNQGTIINLGKPSYGKYNTKESPGTYPMFSKPGGYIPGAHGYYVTPTGAWRLASAVKKFGASPVDMFLNNKTFPYIKEIYPWVVEAHDTFSTIQKEKGCLAKHNFGKDYEII